jgi:hypothetical protein
MATTATQGPLWVDNTVIAAIVENQQQQAERKRPRLYLDRVPTVPADDEEITAVWTANRLSADIIAPDQAARVAAAGTLQFNVTEIPNIKLGARLTQADINRMERLQTRQRAGELGANAVVMFWDSLVRERREGVLDTENHLLAAMLVGQLTYSRLGVNLSITFGMPAGLKTTVTTPWSSTSATPITNVQTMANYTEFTYGWRPDRVTISRTDFTNMIGTDQVKQLAQAYVGIAATNAVNTGDFNLMRNYVGQMLGMDIELDDHVIRTEAADGSVYSARDLPLGTVLLTSKADDNDDMVFDLANAPITEAAVARLTGMTNVNLGGQERGPAVFATAQEANLNPPGINLWGCARAFPRRRRDCVSAVLLV